MFSILFPGQGSQYSGMAKDFYDNFDYVKFFFKEADDLLNSSISKLILEGPKDQLDLTENTQPAIFLVSYSIFNVLKRETSFEIDAANYFAGHSLGEYSALACAESLTFSQTIKLLKKRGYAMQSAVPKGQGGMLAVLGSDIERINDILEMNKDNFNCYVANDNSVGQIVISGSNKDLEKFSLELINNKIKNIKLPVSAPFHCKLMNSATKIMELEISQLEFKSPKIDIVSNVTAEPVNEISTIKELLISQIEKPVRWREIINYMINKNINKFIEIGPGKVLSGLVKRMNRNAELIQINDLEDLKKL
jgi:[acyl-carrier-protein] S-malonyltransferase